MELNDWLNGEVPQIAQSLDEINGDGFFSSKTIGFDGKEKVYKLLNGLRSALFPGLNEKCPVEPARSNIIIGNHIRTAAMDAAEIIEKVLIDDCCLPKKEHTDCTDCHDRAAGITMRLIGALPQLRRTLQTDIAAAYNGDPAAVSTEEILLSYPSIEAISIYRIAHILYTEKVPIIPRIMTEYAHQLTGIDIHPGAAVGHSFFIDHGTGVVIGETCVIGNNVKLYQGVTLGAKSFQLDENNNPVKGIKRHPNIDDNVIIYSGATILGGDTTVGHDSVIGGNVWLTHSVPPHSTVYNAQPKPLITNGQSD